jgi:hypothetical protein
MKNNYLLAFLAVFVGSALMVALAVAEKPQAKPAPIEISLGQSKSDIYKAIGKPDFSILGGKLGDESESYFVYNLNVSYRDNKAAVLTVGLIGPQLPGGLPRPKHDKSQQTVVVLKQGAG